MGRKLTVLCTPNSCSTKKQYKFNFIRLDTSSERRYGGLLLSLNLLPPPVSARWTNLYDFCWPGRAPGLGPLGDDGAPRPGTAVTVTATVSSYGQ